MTKTVKKKIEIKTVRFHCVSPYSETERTIAEIVPSVTDSIGISVASRVLRILLRKVTLARSLSLPMRGHLHRAVQKCFRCPHSFASFRLRAKKVKMRVPKAPTQDCEQKQAMILL